MKPIIRYEEMISKLEKQINVLKSYIDVEFITDETTKFEGKREELFKNLMNAYSISGKINSKFRDILSSPVGLEILEQQVIEKVEKIKKVLLAKAYTMDLLAKDADDFRIYYNHLLSFGKYVHLSKIDIQQTLDESQDKIIVEVDLLSQQITKSISDTERVSQALVKMKFLAENLSMFEKNINDKIDMAIKSYIKIEGPNGIMGLSIELEKNR
ncbi:unnamed protein product [Rotaria sp. Silwood2]|nr:unnamed protein product [Rotaria sp. Silwood2]CAF3100845.1 unnamed protein product [Rotaria sp. Silwood2]CAF3958091.1 unnamed protein product [Rotaria sp. Silwood2]CAF4400299.1 unnamed protein product [Rotaria sp. Silwood2]